MTTHALHGMINDNCSPLTSAFQELFIAMGRLYQRLTNKNAVRHATHGIGRRLSILRVNACHIVRLTDRPTDTPLYGNDQNELGMHLNSFYIHLHGLFDNLAWMLAYEMDLFEDLAEDNHKVRSRIGLFRQDFQKRLNHPDTIELLKKHTEWHSATKRFRDPIAHRVPLYAVPCIFTEEQAKEFNRLQVAEREALLSGDIELMQELHKKKFEIGEYLPVLCQDEDGSPQISPIKELVEHDSSILHEILYHFIANEQSTQP